MLETKDGQNVNLYECTYTQQISSLDDSTITLTVYVLASNSITAELTIKNKYSNIVGTPFIKKIDLYNGMIL